MKTFKMENQIWANLIKVTSDWVSANSLSGWIVKQGYQPEKVNLEDKIIMIHRIATNRYNWQSEKTIREFQGDQLTGFYNRIQYLVDSIFQFSFYCARNPKKDTVNTITASDVANSLLTWFMSDIGLSTMRGYGFGLLRTTELREPVIVNPSENYQKMPNFDITMNYAQEQDYTLNELDRETTIESPYTSTIKGY